MKKRQIIIWMLMVSTLLPSSFSKFNEYLKVKDFTNAKDTLDKWGGYKENDPQYYICQFNYYVLLARKEGVALLNYKQDGRSLEVKDTNTGQVKGYLGQVVNYDQSLINQGIPFIKKGISKYPDHMEMRFGIIWLYSELEDYKSYKDEIENLMKYIVDKKPKYVYWNNNEKISAVNDFILENIQGHISALLSNGKIWDTNQKLITDIIDMMIKYFPNSNLGYSNKGSYLFKIKKYKEANEYFQKALYIDKNDSLVLMNIGLCYKKLNDNKTAKLYFIKVTNITQNVELLDAAKRQIEITK